MAAPKTSAYSSLRQPQTDNNIPVFASPENLFRLEILLSERVLNLQAVANLVSNDAGLRWHVLQLARESTGHWEGEPSAQECIVEIGVEALRKSLDSVLLSPLHQ